MDVLPRSRPPSGVPPQAGTLATGWEDSPVGLNGLMERSNRRPLMTASRAFARASKNRSGSLSYWHWPAHHHSNHSARYREPLMLALNRSFQRRNSSTRASRTLRADVATVPERALRSGIAEGGRGVTKSRPSRTLSADVGTFDGRVLRSGIAAGGRGVKPVSPCPCASRWAAYARSKESAEKAEPPVARAAMTASPISKRFMMPLRGAASMYAHAADICSAGRLLTVKIDGFRRPRSGASRHVAGESRCPALPFPARGRWPAAWR
jgi:hypothetical protein